MMAHKNLMAAIGRLHWVSAVLALFAFERNRNGII
jgi:hypothetical protein